MTPWNEQGTLQKVLLVALAAMTLVAAILFSIRRGQEGYEYHGQLFLMKTENGITTYTGEINDEEAVFTVTPERAISYRQGETEYGPYTITEDPSAYPTEGELAQQITGTGIEIRRGDQVVFRGGYADMAGIFGLFREDGSLETFGEAYGIPDQGGEPSLSTVVDLWRGPELSRKGDGLMFFYGLLFTAAAVALIFFAEALFRWNLAFQIRDPYQAEPSDWEIFSRAFGQVVLTVAAAVTYIGALTAIV